MPPIDPQGARLENPPPLPPDVSPAPTLAGLAGGAPGGIGGKEKALLERAMGAEQMFMSLVDIAPEIAGEMEAVRDSLRAAVSKALSGSQGAPPPAGGNVIAGVAPLR